MIPNFHPSAGDIITGVALLLSVGINGLLLLLVKKLLLLVKNLTKQTQSNEWHLERLMEENATLASNQKPIPWNKGKKGYKLPRKPKEATYVLTPTDGIVAAWDKDGKQTVVPNWEKNV
jgi:hypothetical protein